MQSYRLTLLDEKGLQLLQGLEQLSIIALEPIPNNSGKEISPLNVVQNKDSSSWKDLKGSVPSLRPISESSDVIKPENETSEDNSSNGGSTHPLWKFKGMWNLKMTLDEIDAEVDKMREGWR